MCQLLLQAGTDVHATDKVSIKDYNKMDFIVGLMLPCDALLWTFAMLVNISR